MHLEDGTPTIRSRRRSAANRRAPTSRTVSQRRLRSTMLPRRKNTRKPVLKEGTKLLTANPPVVVNRRRSYNIVQQLLPLGRAPSQVSARRRVLAKIETREMTPPKVSKHELRTRETRELLLHAAETIFVRDGYEGAELGEVAALAGRTKGAIYAHFKS